MFSFFQHAAQNQKMGLSKLSILHLACLVFAANDILSYVFSSPELKAQGELL